MDENVQAVVKEVEKYKYGLKMLDEKSYRNVITYILITMLCEKSTETEKHARRMVIYSDLIGKKLQLSSKEKDELSLLAALHDIGKICINPLILHKPSKLTSSEWDEMRRHSEIGCQIAKMVPELDSIAEFILYHHERWNGEGYPHGLKGEDIPLLCRILAVVDAYDAMTNNRVYRSAMNKEEAIIELKNNAGTQFDPGIVDLFLGLYKDGDI